MTQVLAFTLYAAPLASCGAIAVGNRRVGWSRPGRSAVMGLVAAAMGICKTDEDAYQALERGLHCAIRVDAPGSSTEDWQVALCPDGGSRRTRAEGLATGRKGTVISRREWLQDAFWTVGLWRREGELVIALGPIAKALEEPHWPVYAGRKAAVPALPLRPEVLEGAGWREALRRRRPNAMEKVVLHTLGAHEGRTLWAVDADAKGVEPDHRVERRRDRTVHHGRRQHGERSERVWHEGGEEEPYR